MCIRDRKEAVHKYTYDVLYRLKIMDCAPDMVQIGNEIRSGMLFPDGAVPQLSLIHISQATHLHKTKAYRPASYTGYTSLICLESAHWCFQTIWRSLESMQMCIRDRIRPRAKKALIIIKRNKVEIES